MSRAQNFLSAFSLFQRMMRQPRREFVIVVIMLAPLQVNAARPKQQLFPTDGQLASLRADQAWSSLQRVCQADLDIRSSPVADFSPLPHYTATGVRPYSGSDDPELQLSRDSLAVYQLSLCFEDSKDAAYSTKAEQILEVWARATKLITTGQGRADFDFSFPFALIGAALLSRDAAWHSDTFADFVRDVVAPANESSRDNNHGNWGVLLLATAGSYLKNREMLERAADRWQQLLHVQVAADGSLPQEICRSDTSNYCGGPTKGIQGIHYTHYTLMPSTIAAEVLRAQGYDLYSTPAGRSFCKAYGRAAEWSFHPETFPYFASNGGKLQGVHNIDYFFALQHRCPVSAGAALLDQFGSTVPDGLYLRALYRK